MTAEVEPLTDDEIRRGVLRQFYDRGLAGPDLARLQRLVREVKDGRSYDSIGAGLDHYLRSVGK